MKFITYCLDKLKLEEVTPTERIEWILQSPSISQANTLDVGSVRPLQTSIQHVNCAITSPTRGPSFQ